METAAGQGAWTILEHLKLGCQTEVGATGRSLQFFLLGTSRPTAAPTGALEIELSSKILGPRKSKQKQQGQREPGWEPLSQDTSKQTRRLSMKQGPKLHPSLTLMVHLSGGSLCRCWRGGSTQPSPAQP